MQYCNIFLSSYFTGFIWLSETGKVVIGKKEKRNVNEVFNKKERHDIYCWIVAAAVYGYSVL